MPDPVPVGQAGGLTTQKSGRGTLSSTCTLTTALLALTSDTKGIPDQAVPIS